MPDHITLRDVIPSDLEIFFEHQRDPEGSKMASFPPRDREAFMEHWQTKILGNPEVFEQTVLRDGEVAGSIGTFPMEGMMQVGYWIGREHWGRGVATRALELLLEKNPQRPIHAYVAVANRASIRVLEKCGFAPDPEFTPEEGEGPEEFRFVLRS